MDCNDNYDLVIDSNLTYILQDTFENSFTALVNGNQMID